MSKGPERAVKPKQTFSSKSLEAIQKWWCIHLHVVCTKMIFYLTVLGIHIVLISTA